MAVQVASFIIVVSDLHFSSFLNALHAIFYCFIKAMDSKGIIPM
jgi:nitrate reductase NapAB chaperone NapD